MRHKVSDSFRGNASNWQYEIQESRARVSVALPRPLIFIFRGKITFIHLFHFNKAIRVICGSDESRWGARGAYKPALKSTDTAGQLEVLRSHGDSVGVGGTEAGVSKEADKEDLGCLLERHHSGRLKSKINIVKIF